MKRRTTGRYEVTVVAGERVKAFVPAPLPPKPSLDLGRGLQAPLEQALLALGRLDAVSMSILNEGTEAERPSRTRDKRRAAAGVRERPAAERR
jgi:hypothetical protein